MDDRLKCSLCLDPFKDPRILTCFHSFCKECLQGYIANSETVRNDPDAVKFTCPVCRSENELPQSGVDGVQKNFYLPDTGLCPDHPMEDLRFYCRDCKEAICRDCKVVSHMTHTTDMVDKVADEMRHELETLLDKTKAEINEKENTLLENVKKDIEVFDNAHASMQRTRKAMKHEVNELFTDVVNKINFHNCSRQGILGLLEEDCVEPGSGLGHHRLARYKDALSYAVVNKQSHVVLELHKALCDSDNEINKMKELSLIVQCRLKANPPKMIVFAQRLQEAYEELAWKVEQLLDEFRGGDAMKSPMESSTVRLRYPSSNTADNSPQKFEGEVKCELTGPVPPELCPWYGAHRWSTGGIVLTKGDPHWSLEVQLCQSDHAVKEDLKVQLNKETLLFCSHTDYDDFEFNLCYPPATQNKITIIFKFGKDIRRSNESIRKLRDLMAAVYEIQRCVEKEKKKANEQPDATSLEEVTGQSSNQVILEQPSQERPTQTSVEQPPFEETLAQPTNEELTQPHRAEPVSSGEKDENSRVRELREELKKELKKQKFNKKKEQKKQEKLKFARTEARLIQIDIEIKKALQKGNVDIVKSLSLLKELEILPVNKELLKKNPEVCNTVKKCRRFGGCEKIRRKCEEIHEKFKNYFGETTITRPKHTGTKHNTASVQPDITDRSPAVTHVLLDSSDEENCFKTEIPQITSHASEKTFPAIESQSTSEMVQNLQASLAENDNSNMTRNSLITNYFRPANSDNSTDMEASEISRTSTTVTSLGMEEVKSDHNPDRSDLIIGATSAVIREEGIKKEPSADTEYVPVLEEMPMVSNATITNEEQPVVWIKIERENRNGPDTVRDNALILKEMVSNATSPSNELPVVRVMPKVSNNINTSKEQSVVRIKIEPNNKTNSDASTESGDATSTAEEQPVLRIKIERENETDSNAQDYCIWGSNGT